MTAEPESSASSPPDEWRNGGWGLGDVAGGVVASQVLVAAVSGAAMAVAGWRRTTDVPLWGLALLQLPLWAGWVGALVVAGRKGAGVVADFGVRARRIDVPVGLAIGAALQLVALPLIYLPVLRLLGQTTDDLSRPAKELSDRANGLVGWLLFALLVGVLAPIIEEIFYRGLLQRALQKRGVPDNAAVVLTAGLFAAMHLEPLQFIGLFVFGVVAGLLAARTGRLGPSIAAHIGFNLTTVLTLYLLRS